MAQRRVLLGCVLVSLGGGCAPGEDNFPVPVPGGDGSLPERVVTGPPSDAGGTVTDAPRGPDGTSAADGGGPRITVQIETPMANVVHRAAERFAPSVNVTVDSSGVATRDVVNEVTATITEVGARMPGGSTRLNQTKIDGVPESATEIYRYTGTPIDISSLHSGAYEMVVRARTLAGALAEGKVMFMVDAGPQIRIDSPEEKKPYRSSATVNVTITDSTFGPVEGVTMTLGQHPITFNGPTGPGNDQYTATIEFNKYDPPLEGDQLLVVRAQNSKKTPAVALRKFVADDKGPTIASTVPATGALIGRVINISASVSDPAGVDPKVVAVVAHGDIAFEVRLQPPVAGGGGSTYTGLFDTVRLPVNALYPSISFRASDSLGNESSVGYLLSLDNTPPVVDLDPPADFRLVREMDGADRCSHPFDPVGPDAVSDGQVVTQLFDIRARIEDQGNTPLSGTADLIPISGIDDGRVQLLILDDTSQVLVVDSNGDGLCDNINPLLTPTTSPMSATDALLINLVPVPVGGSGDFTPLPPGSPCRGGPPGMSPRPLCDTTFLTASIPYTTGNSPAIYTIPPVVGDRLQCVGRQFDALGSSVKDGWICMAVAVADSLGNLQVSRPIRACVDKDGMGNECTAGTPMPNCTGTLTMVSGTTPMIDPTKPCQQWRRFPNNEFRRAL